MSDTVIRVENLSKKYIIGHQQEGRYRYKALRDVLADGIKSIGSRILNPKQNIPDPTREEFWALKDVSFEIKQGDRVGIIGRNGAGKSTLLKVLSRITEPTNGRVSIKGRVASLLEVGTGFHPELTGRENIYLNGAILGMGKEEIKRKFDEIIDFAEVEKFLDTPVKRYSSGMYVRLAFAVAAHLEPEILVVDEVLAVGDAKFQKKCLGKMSNVAQEGRTVLFVSHNMVAIKSLCPSIIWLQNGQINGYGKSDRVISDYLQSDTSLQTEQTWNDREKAPGNDIVRLYRLHVQPQNGSRYEPITMETPIEICVEFWNLIPNVYLDITLHIYTEQDIIAFTTCSLMELIFEMRLFPAGLFRSTCSIPGNFLNSGIYRITLLVVQDGSNVVYNYENIISFDVIDSGEREGSWYGKEPGVVHPHLEWKAEYLHGV